MGERRALLDPEMYKISEEDSQDEEVLSAGALASYADEVLKLGEDATTSTITAWNNNVPPPVLPPKGWGNSNGTTIDNSNYIHDDTRYLPQASSSFSSAMHRFSGGVSSKYKMLQGQGQDQSSSSLVNLRKSKFSLPAQLQDLEGDCVDWPDTSTNSDSCLSSDDRRLNKRQAWVFDNTEVGHALNNHKFISRTYFGDDLRQRSAGDGSSFTYLDEEEEDSLPPPCHVQSLPLPIPPPPPPSSHHKQTKHHRKHYQKRSRRRSVGATQRVGSNYSESTSGSDYSDESSDESPCVDCRGTVRTGIHSTGEGRSASSSDAEDYEDESSYTESSFDEYDETYEDEFENEYFEDIVKFLSDNEFESSTNADGDLFLVEYSAESEISDADQPSPRISVSSRELTPQIESDFDTEAPNTTNTLHSVIASSKSADSQEPTPSSSSSTHFQKSGKSAKGKISRLLKRKKDLPSSKIQIESDEPVALSITKTETENNLQTSPKISNSNSNNTNSGTKLPQSSSTLLSTITKQKVRSGTKMNAEQNSGGSGAQPEKVFRFKDEHGGETRTVFVDVPQSDGNLLGRRATLIESVLGILPGRFSTPAQNPVDPTEQNADRIMVAGFVPDGVASRYRRIKIGDWLQSVDDIPVDHANVDQVLSSRSMYGKRRTAFETEYLRLKLTLTRVAGCMVSLPTTQTDADIHEDAGSTHHLSTELKWSCVSQNVQSNIAILYISSGHGGNSANNSTANENSVVSTEDNPSSTSQSNGATGSSQKEKSNDIVFCWPKEGDSKLVKALTSSQGMFSTLYRLLWDVTGSHPLVSRVVIDDLEVDVTYTSDDQGKSLFLVAVATTLSSYNINYKKSNTSCMNGNLPSQEESMGGEGKKKEKKIRWREPQGKGANVTVSTRVLSRLEALLKYQFGSFARGFGDNSIEKASRLVINAISALNDLSEDFLFPQAPGNFLRFPNSIRSGIDDVLYSFETSDTVYSRSKNSPRRQSQNDLPVFHCHGSCLMYKGFLVTSHLRNELASAFHGWWRTQLGLWEGVKRNSLMERWKPVSRLALWQQTCLPRKNDAFYPQENPNLEDHEESEFEAHKHRPSPTRTFSAMVGVGNFTLGFVLEHLTDSNGHVGPDSDWIRRAMATICRLYHSGLTRSFECWLEKQGDKHEFVELSGISPTSSTKHHHKQSPQTGNAISPNHSKSNSSSGTLKKTGGTNSILKNADAVQLPYNQSCPIHSVGAASTTSSSSSASSTCSCPSQSTSSPFPPSTMKGFTSASPFSLGGSGVRSGIAAQLQQSSMNSPLMDPSTQVIDGDSDGDETTTGSDTSSFKWYETSTVESNPNWSPTTGGDVKSIRVTRGNLLFDYIQIEFGRGVVLSSKDVHEGWASVIRHNFRQSVTIIHSILHKASKARSRLEERGQDKKWVSKALAPISEHGILFNCQITEPRDLQKRKPRRREVNYWVVGRIYPEEREVYVCYEDGPLSQNIVELAYKIALNVHC